MAERKQAWSLALSVLVAVAFYLLVDFWNVRGSVVDAFDGSTLENSEVLVTLLSRGVKSPVPHGARTTSRCVRSILLKTDSGGRFDTKQFSLAQLWTKKIVSIQVFLPGWYADKPISLPKGVLGISERFTVTIKRDRGERWSFIGDGRSTPPMKGLQTTTLEGSMSRAFTETADLIRGEQSCGSEARKFQANVLRYALANARTEDEREYVGLQCVGAQNLLSARARSRGTGERAFHESGGGSLPRRNTIDAYERVCQEVLRALETG